MYLDSRGFVTVGVGHLLSNTYAAQKVFFQTEAGDAASDDAIANEFLLLQQQESNRVASYYQSFTSLHVSDKTMNALTDKHIDSFYHELQIIYSEFNAFPRNVKLALFDLIFNLGMTALRKKWPKLNGCIAKGDWIGAAEHCRRRGIADARNDYVKSLLERGDETSVA
jgi:GH24 family phage-related lysozyme (muramidase)